MAFEYNPKDYDKELPDLNEVLRALSEALYEATRNASLETARQAGAEALRATQVYLRENSAVAAAAEGER